MIPHSKVVTRGLKLSKLPAIDCPQRLGGPPNRWIFRYEKVPVRDLFSWCYLIRSGAGHGIIALLREIMVKTRES
jgi:hypothetical protein